MMENFFILMLLIYLDGLVRRHASYFMKLLELRTPIL